MKTQPASCRIDELGQVVIPKVRRAPSASAGETRWRSLQQGTVSHLQKVFAMGELSGVTAQYVDV